MGKAQRNPSSRRCGNPSAQSGAGIRRQCQTRTASFAIPGVRGFAPRVGNEAHRTPTTRFQPVLHRHTCWATRIQHREGKLSAGTDPHHRMASSTRPLTGLAVRSPRKNRPRVPPDRPLIRRPSRTPHPEPPSHPSARAPEAESARPDRSVTAVTERTASAHGMIGNRGSSATTPDTRPKAPQPGPTEAEAQAYGTRAPDVPH